MTLGVANIIFSSIRNCPLEFLNTRTFRRRLLKSISESVDNFHDEELQHLMSLLQGYTVHFIPCSTDYSSCCIYAFENFDGNISILLGIYRCLFDTWGKRQFNGYVAFPQIYTKLVEHVNQLLIDLYPPFEGNAAIINCYSGSYFLRLHKDDAEETDDPILNFSLGAPAIFCIGGVDQRTPLLSMVVDSGSLVVMSGPSRRCLHGIAKLLHYRKPGLDYGKYTIDTEHEIGSESVLAFAKPRFLRHAEQCPQQIFSHLQGHLPNLNSAIHSLTGIRTSISIRKAV
ncbi:bifunctional Alpha-ketoglutarate-dependent dioxygenase AlkB-like/Alkylated DNA repair protein AlkB/Alpha-ketoglutarate-dependent dioxygenase AlkB-like superfamily [Babesia duncani]|uniref:Bifunctional Alpha-ketoglutarate-dependent dioxygenase AlkB-like/Alkylated DNA repair protein AlkB/Alpha-ketoglutarate-dependent dioxygenase AlkB-like superfamily n=1 Tax=Babesia duncani TaxID=323732 RepID=A0AAD9PMD1_9APIC|nr:bifunctional Alpha-ketoglutarate-dependent dioxygenase AlkB-like/Alkylated DNA repair protein AlkB/Alpha-ketoglutarate-dependent dioxygenase AlkB-like superfamily [Babesia duncani]KAK2197551.1 bifunctional Alpha-ketoglutarate-dependent dioxygenase AlkB-like/Alkylated DNA repair protein AlkB/Alpha-ketoglutarate-dependent dioxygenase AlkB-like superfamily [Babesia duncani]